MVIDLEALLAPIPGENPCGENLRYSETFDNIKEARRADDLLDQGDWQHEVKLADWNQAQTLSVEALTTLTKDLQITAWLMEALTHLQGFDGVKLGFQIFNGLFQNFWETLYPEIDDGDLDFRAGPLEFLNDKLWLPIRQIPLTDPSTSRGFSFMEWQESRQVGSEKEVMNDDKRRKAREQMIEEGKVSLEEFDSGVRTSSRAFYETLFTTITQCQEEFILFDTIVDEKFGKEAPRLAELKDSLADCLRLVSNIVKEKRELEPDPEPVGQDNTEDNEKQLNQEENPGYGDPSPENFSQSVPAASPGMLRETGTIEYKINRLMGGGGMEEALWQNSIKLLDQKGIRSAMEPLLAASCSAQSTRERTNFRLLMARLCLRANRPDLARPILEELNSLIDELQLSRWESPIWLADALGTLYQCLMAKGSTDDDHHRAAELLTRLCILDVTKAMEFSGGETEE